MKIMQLEKMQFILQNMVEEYIMVSQKVGEQETDCNIKRKG